MWTEMPEKFPQSLKEGGGAGLGPPPPRVIPSGCCSFPGPWTVTRSALRMLRRVAAFCRPLRPVLLLVSFSHSRSPPPPNSEALGRGPPTPFPLLQ